MSIMTIFAALLVFPPDLMTPADASAAFMNEMGPEAVPPPAKDSLEARKLDMFIPAPEPPLKIIPS
jgi:hypothetical protein